MVVFSLRRKRLLMVVLALFLSVFLVTCSAVSSREKQVKEAVDMAADYLMDTVQDDGMFVYRVNMNPEVNVSEKYNMLRHAGTIYSMASYYQREPNEELLSAIEKAGAYLRDESIAPIEDGEGVLAVWSYNDVNRSGSPDQVKLGGTGLGLVALMSIEQIEPGFTPLEDLQALGRSIIFMQKEDGSFYSKYVPSQGGLQDEWTSLYYPGEAALGLMMLYENDPSEEWLNAASKVLEYLAISRQGQVNVPADHWALLATAKLLSLDNVDELPVSRDLLIEHAIQITKVILDDQVLEADDPMYVGGFTWDGRTTPTATRLEGLQAVLTFLPVDEVELRGQIESAVETGIDFLLASQVMADEFDGQFEGAIPRAIDFVSDEAYEADDFNRRATEVRIDYVQHALSAMIQYLEWYESS